MAKKSPLPIPPLEPRSKRQSEYSRALRSQPVVFGLGPAGTGKTYVAAQYAAERLATDDTHRLILLRPLVTVDEEEMGFLPGTMGSKIGPFMVPIMEELTKVAGHERVRAWTPRIEATSIAHIRGRNFDNCTVHVTEAQNLTLKQAEAIVTRMGENATLVIEGDPGQSDIEGDALLKLLTIARKAEVPHAAVEFTTKDIVRSEIVKRWVEAFDGARG